jgi:hypothetical protein
MSKQIDDWLAVFILVGSAMLSLTLLILGVWKLFELTTLISW